MKETFYFSHDYNTRADIKIKRLMSRHGMTGYGIFWAIIEDLYNNANALRLDYDCIAYDLRTDSDTIKSIINDFELFEFDGEYFGSISVERRLTQRAERSEKARGSALERWSKKAKAMRSHNGSNAIKERKGKENKGINIPIQINGFKKIPHLSDFYSQQIHVADLYEKENPEAESDVKEYKKFIAYLYDYSNIDKVDPAGLTLCRPRKNLLEIRDQLRFIDFAKQIRRAREIGVNVYDKLEAMENSPNVKGRLDFDRTMTTWLKPFVK